MANTSKLKQLLNMLEDTLVKEFRACQNLYQVTKEERIALSDNDLSQLLSLVERKEALLDELGQLDDSRRMATQEIGSLMGLPSESLQSPTVADILAVLDPDTAGRLGHLRAGVLALMDKVRDLTHGNRALATTALERTDALQAFLLSLYQPPPSYRPSQSYPVSEGPTVIWGVDQAA